MLFRFTALTSFLCDMLVVDTCGHLPAAAGISGGGGPSELAADVVVVDSCDRPVEGVADDGGSAGSI